MWICRNALKRADAFSHKFRFVSGRQRCAMSVLDDFTRMRFYRKRASEFELLADAEVSPDVQRRYRIVARHYRDLAAREEQADKARIAERIGRIRLRRPQTAQAIPTAGSDAQFFLVAAE